MLTRLGTICALVAVSLLTIVPPGVAAADDAAPSTVEQLFVQTARNGTLRPVKGEQDVYTLTLRGVAPRVTSFTDRPLRTTSPLGVEEFLQNWDGGTFETDPPNAALVIADAPERRDTFVFELTAPEFDAKRDVLRYTAALITDEADGRLVGFADQVDERPPTTFGRSSLFVDSLPSTTMTIEFANIPAGSQVFVTIDGGFLEPSTFQPTAGTFARTSYGQDSVIVNAGAGANAAATAVVRFCVVTGRSLVSVSMFGQDGASVTLELGSESMRFTTTPGEELTIPAEYQLAGCGQ